MRNIVLASLVLATSLLIALPATAIDVRYAGKPDARKFLETAIPAAIELVEKKQYATFIRRYAHPKDLEKILKDQSFDELVAEFSKDNADRVLKTLRLIQTAKPILDDNGNKATYKLKEEDGPDHVRWKREDGLWYILNH